MASKDSCTKDDLSTATNLIRRSIKDLRDELGNQIKQQTCKHDGPGKIDYLRVEVLEGAYPRKPRYVFFCERCGKCVWITDGNVPAIVRQAVEYHTPDGPRTEGGGPG